MGTTPGSARRAAALGTFAVTFGLGLAVATGTAGVAAASSQESGDTSTAASHSPQDSDTTGDDSDTPSTSGADGDGVTSADSTPDADSGSESDESAEELETPSATLDSETPTLSDHSDSDRGEVEAEAEVDIPGSIDTSEPQPAEDDSPPRGAHTEVDLGAPEVATSPSADISTVVPTAASTAAISTPPTPPTPRAARLLKLFGETLPQQVAEGPASPRLKTFLLGILNSIYRKYEHFYLNGAPIADPKQLITRPERGVVIGALNATDPDGDELRYFVEQQGAFGRLTVDSNGIWTYERAANAPAGAYTDTVTVAVDDRGLTYSDVIAGFGFQPNRTVLKVLTEVPPLTSSPAPVTTAFLVSNQTSHWVNVTGYENPDFGDKLYNPPAVGTRIPPGGLQSFEMIYYFPIGGLSEAVYITSPQATFKVDFNVTIFGIPITSCNKTTSGGRAGSCSDPFIGVGNSVVIRE
ncbi:YVTN family beta-propeller repeat protein [Mycolicibacterium aurum]|uniref:YVTN family beta-propeller repeat protein n=1 Tax=Mycolicibacterium aurum TaxID=1791 RepID=A0A448IHS9_MYCAU|nr:YVTN family beta-propeller repeat protein [Mycolicibacterium aurum]